VTELAAAGSPEWLPRLREVIRGSTHEMRNALNGLVVNLEVVRSRLARSGDGEGLLSFAEQSAAQAEEAVRLNEGVGALLSLMAGSVDGNGQLRCASVTGASSGIRFDADSSTAERVLPAIRSLGMAVGFSAETHDGAVILTFRQKSSAEFKEHE
jgi:hypothetical protein